MREKNMRRK